MQAPNTCKNAALKHSNCNRFACCYFCVAMTTKQKLEKAVEKDCRYY